MHTLDNTFLALILEPFEFVSENKLKWHNLQEFQQHFLTIMPAMTVEVVFQQTSSVAKEDLYQRLKLGGDPIMHED